MTSRLRKERRLGTEERKTSINEPGEPRSKAAVAIEKSATRSQKPESSVEKTASHRKQKPAILVELTEYTRGRVAKRTGDNQRSFISIYCS